MGNNLKKRFVALAVTGGIMFAGLGSCVGISTQTALQALGYYIGLSYVLDNDSVFDLVVDGNPEEDEE